MRQVEVSRTLVFDAPRRARAFFEALVADNLDIGRPDEVQAHLRPRQIAGHTTRSQFATRVVDPGHRGDDRLLLQAQPDQAVFERRQGPSDRDRDQQPHRSRVPRRLDHLRRARRARPERSTDACLMIQRAGQGCAIEHCALWSASHQPYATRRAKEPEPCASGINAPWPWPAHSVSALHTVIGFTNKSLRGLGGPDCSAVTTAPPR